jgi:hypothetical protein
MTTIITFIIGAIGGFMINTITMKISFKQRTIDDKVKVYDALIGHWVKVRNYIYTFHPTTTGHDIPENVGIDFDQIYGESQQLVGEALLICENEELTERINTLNERMYRTKWENLSRDKTNEQMEEIKLEAFSIIKVMREDIKSNTILHWSDFTHILSGLRNRS